MTVLTTIRIISSTIKTARRVTTAELEPDGCELGVSGQKSTSVVVLDGNSSLKAGERDACS